jgi:hypothetical protein
MIGLRLGLCVRDLARGVVPLDQVVLIHACSMCKRPDDWKDVVKKCRSLHWNTCEREAEAIFKQLLTENKIKQPRLEGRFPEIVNFRHWVKTPDQIHWQRAGEDVPYI